uniref:Uncharacterized protein n=1 Tax=Cacopsylla melanoneura TaxID=428564 RepID=A0A8D8R9Z6_9HEMI
MGFDHFEKFQLQHIFFHLVSDRLRNGFHKSVQNLSVMVCRHFVLKYFRNRHRFDFELHPLCSLVVDTLWLVHNVVQTPRENHVVVCRSDTVGQCRRHLLR